MRREQGRPPIHDWAAVIAEILGHGYTCSKIAHLIGVPKRTVEEWRDGNRIDLKHADATRVLGLLELARRADLQRSQSGEPAHATESA